MKDKEKKAPKDKAPKAAPTASAPKTGQPKPTHDLVAEQAREAAESQKARDAEASIRDHMVDIGRGHQQSGRQGS